MINEDPNMGRKQIFSELPLPSKVEEKGILNLIYKGVFIIVKLLLDIRLNLVKISEGKPIKTKHKEFQNRGQKPSTEKPVDNAVIKDTDNITVKTKVDDSTVDVEASNKVEPELKADTTGGINDKSPDEESKDQDTKEEK